MHTIGTRWAAARTRLRFGAVARDAFPALMPLSCLTALAYAARGEISAGADPGLVFDLLFGPLVYRWLRGSPPDDETVGRLIDLARQGLCPSDG